MKNETPGLFTVPAILLLANLLNGVMKKIRFYKRLVTGAVILLVLNTLINIFIIYKVMT